MTIVAGHRIKFSSSVGRANLIGPPLRRPMARRGLIAVRFTKLT